jgi:hypothetical protein
MIKGVRTVFYSSQAGQLHALLCDKLGFEAIDIEGDMGITVTTLNGYK